VLDECRRAPDLRQVISGGGLNGSAQHLLKAG
jgi:hypothetical protein